MTKEILIINLCKEKLHYFEFVKPIGEIVKSLKFGYSVKHYKNISKRDLDNCSKIIICGTSLLDNEFVNHLKYFSWLKETEKPVFGICAGMQIIGLIFGPAKKELLKIKTEIGFYKENFAKNFLGLQGEQGVYHLHNNYIDFSNIKEFEIFCQHGEIIQAVKHNEKMIFGALFHPEIRNKEIITNFCKLS